jgi:hypothetical protein
VKKSGSPLILTGPVRAPTGANRSRACPPWGRARVPLGLKGTLTGRVCALRAPTMMVGPIGERSRLPEGRGVRTPYDGACTI